MLTGFLIHTRLSECSPHLWFSRYFDCHCKCLSKRKLNYVNDKRCLTATLSQPHSLSLSCDACALDKTNPLLLPLLPLAGYNVVNKSWFFLGSALYLLRALLYLRYRSLSFPHALSLLLLLLLLRWPNQVLLCWKRIQLLPKFQSERYTRRTAIYMTIANSSSWAKVAKNNEKTQLLSSIDWHIHVL